MNRNIRKTGSMFSKQFNSILFTFRHMILHFYGVVKWSNSYQIIRRGRLVMGSHPGPFRLPKEASLKVLQLGHKPIIESLKKNPFVKMVT